MMSRRHLHFLTHPAQSLHAARKHQCMQLGMPAPMVQSFWGKPALSFFLIKKLNLLPAPPLDMAQKLQRAFLLDGKILEQSFIRLGLARQAEFLRRLINGHQRRKFLQEAGEENLDFIRRLPPACLPPATSPRWKREQILASGMEVFLSALPNLAPQHYARLLLKLPFLPELETRLRPAPNNAPPLSDRLANLVFAEALDVAGLA